MQIIQIFLIDQNNHDNSNNLIDQNNNPDKNSKNLYNINNFNNYNNNHNIFKKIIKYLKKNCLYKIFNGLMEIMPSIVQIKELNRFF